MKKLFILVLISVAFLTQAQTQTNFNDLPVKSSTANSDEHIIVVGGTTSHRMTTGVLLSDVTDSLDKHTDTLQLHQQQISDLYDTAAIHLDTLQSHNTRLIAVEGGGGTSYTFDSGLTETAGDVDWGGALTAATVIDAETYSLTIDADNTTNQSTRIIQEPTSIQLTKYKNTGHSAASGTYQVYIGSSSAGILAFNGAAASSVDISESEMLITDAIYSKGFIYAGNYDTAGILDDDWLSSYRAVKAYVDKQYTGALTDGAPTDAQIDTATGTSPAGAGAGWNCTILDTDGSALVYTIVSDGTNWQYTALTIAL